MNRTTNTVIIAHDYLCPWCWIGFFQAQHLAQEFPQIKQDWVGYELLPESLGPLPDYKPAPKDPNAPPSRLEVLLKHEGLTIPEGRTVGIVRTHDALQGAEYFKAVLPAGFDKYNEGVYRAFWERDENISDIEVLARIAVNAGAQREDFVGKIQAKAYSSKIVEFDDGAYADDVTHVPTFMFRGERCAEASYEVISSLAQRFIAWYGDK